NERAVGGIEVHEHPDPFPALQLGVAGGHGRIGYDEVVVIGPPDVHYGTPHRQALTDQPPAPHEETRERAARGRSGGSRYEGLETMHGMSEAVRRAGGGAPPGQARPPVAPPGVGLGARPAG